MIECVICTRHPHPPEDDCTRACRTFEATMGLTCEPCARTIRTNLDAIVELYALTEQPEYPSSGSGPGGKTAPLPGGTEWMSWRQAADLIGPSGILSTWARDWMETYALAGPKGGTVSQVTGWLVAHLSSACNSHPAITEFAGEIADLHRVARRIAGVDADPGQRVLCPTDMMNGSNCGRRLSIEVARPEEEIRCRGCGTVWTSARLLLVSLDSEAEAWLDPEAASRLANVDQSRLRAWARSGKIQRRNGLYLLQSIKAAKASA